MCPNTLTLTHLIIKLNHLARLSVSKRKLAAVSSACSPDHQIGDGMVHGPRSAMVQVTAAGKTVPGSRDGFISSYYSSPKRQRDINGGNAGASMRFRVCGSPTSSRYLSACMLTEYRRRHPPPRRESLSTGVGPPDSSIFYGSCRNHISQS